MSEDHPNFGQVDLDDVRKLEMSYSCANPGEAKLMVEYVGGRVRGSEMDPRLVERRLRQLDYTDTIQIGR